MPSSALDRLRQAASALRYARETKASKERLEACGLELYLAFVAYASDGTDCRDIPAAATTVNLESVP